MKILSNGALKLCNFSKCNQDKIQIEGELDSPNVESQIHHLFKRLK